MVALNVCYYFVYLKVFVTPGRGALPSLQLYSCTDAQTKHAQDARLLCMYSTHIHDSISTRIERKLRWLEAANMFSCRDLWIRHNRSYGATTEQGSKLQAPDKSQRVKTTTHTN